MADARRMGKSELFSHFAERFEVKRTQAREFFDELTQLAEKELKRSGEFVLPGMVKLVPHSRQTQIFNFAWLCATSNLLAHTGQWGITSQASGVSKAPGS